MRRQIRGIGWARLVALVLAVAGAGLPARAFDDAWTSERVTVTPVSHPLVESGTAIANAEAGGPVIGYAGVSESLPAGVRGVAGSVAATAEAFVVKRFTGLTPGLFYFLEALVDVPSTGPDAPQTSVTSPEAGLCTGYVFPTDLDPGGRCLEVRATFVIRIRYCDAAGCSPRTSPDSLPPQSVIACDSSDPGSSCFGGRRYTGTRTLGTYVYVPAGKTGFEADVGVVVVASATGGGSVAPGTASGRVAMTVTSITLE